MSEQIKINLIYSIAYGLNGGLMGYIFGAGWKKSFFSVFTVNILFNLLSFFIPLADLFDFIDVQNIYNLFIYLEGLTISLVLVLLFIKKKVKAKAVVLSLGFMFIVGFLISMTPFNNILLPIALAWILLPLGAGLPIGLYKSDRQRYNEMKMR